VLSSFPLDAIEPEIEYDDNDTDVPEGFVLH